MKRLSAIAATLLLASVAAAQEHTERSNPAPPPAQTQAQGQRYISDAGRYSIMFPSEPKLSTQNISSPTGDAMTQYMAMSMGQNLLFMVGYFDYGSGIVFNLDKARDGMLDSVKGTLLDEQSISLGGAPGKQIRIVGRTDEGIEFINRARFYDISPRVFVLQCMVQRSQDGPEASDRCERFFDSFRVRAPGPG